MNNDIAAFVGDEVRVEPTEDGNGLLIEITDLDEVTIVEVTVAQAREIATGIIALL